MCTRIKNTISETIDVKIGVPQGSNLGPLLFILYINEIDSLLKHSKIILYADDIALVSINYKHDEMLKNLQDDFDVLQRELLKDDLYINEDKTKWMLIKTSHMQNINCKRLYIHTYKCNKINLDGGVDKCQHTCLEIKRVTNFKYLGIILDDRWNFEGHINHLIKKIRCMVPKLYSLKDILSLKCLKSVYQAWVESHIRYGLEIYYNTAEYRIKRLQRLQNKVIKMLFKKFDSNKNTEEILEENKIKNILKLRNAIIIKKYYLEKNCLKRFTL